MAATSPAVLSRRPTPVVSIDPTTGLAVSAGDASAANQATIIGHIDGIETLIGTTNTSLTTVIGHVDGVEASLTTLLARVLGLSDALTGEYETVAASQTTQTIGATGATGDFLAGVLIIPATAAAGAVSIKDGSETAIQVFAGGGTTALPTLAPIYVPLNLKSRTGAWQITTGANVSVIAGGNFT